MSDHTEPPAPPAPPAPPVRQRPRPRPAADTAPAEPVAAAPGPAEQGYAPPAAPPDYPAPGYPAPGYLPPGYGPPEYGPPGYGPPGYPPPGYPPAYGYPPGYPGYAYPRPVLPLRAVRGLGIAVGVLLGLQLLAYVGLAIALVHARGIAIDLRDDPLHVSLSDAKNVDHILQALGTIVTVSLLATAVVWIVWFYKCRENAETWGPAYQRRAIGWAIGSWICPIVNLWFPYQMARDIADGTEAGPNDSPWERKPRPLFIAWWLAYLAQLIVGRIVLPGVSHDHPSADQLITEVDVGIGLTVVTAVAAVLAILVVRQITEAQESRRAASPWAA